jgi:hypothetical protein
MGSGRRKSAPIGGIEKCSVKETKPTFDSERSGEVNWGITTGSQKLDEIPILVSGVVGIECFKSLGLPVECDTRTNTFLAMVAASHQSTFFSPNIVIIF